MTKLISNWCVELWIAFWLMCATLTTCAGPAQASYESDQLWLARICVHEATWAGMHTNDCGALYQTLRNQDRGDIRRALSIYSSRFYGGTSGRAWARALRPVMQSQHWPTGAGNYTNNYQRWREVYERAGRIVRGEENVPCEGSPSHWGSRTHPVDRARARRAIREGRWREVRCGETRNAFYEVVRHCS